ncbi:efflux RND transporter periplasmic adaptor subunit [Pseudoxanthomonas composti]|uniref:Efflux RND transporter periplasmic adaptor subunit n=1 Tax=Pseudoxanthomonas composti TaxID=2137479 RepID=A0A4Q1JVH3_9GAMM|nr:efflux RND transporter periplasmic adaptor subunit [Pseudoxanthomonas composti]RXR05169.1 efflux RND transporter periplasmic adaptor subunit [Pseudoxanthomonas composti]
MSRKWKIALWVIGGVVVLGLGLRMCHRPEADAGRGPGAGMQGQGNGGEPAGPVPVTVVPVARQDVPVYLTALGTVSALNTVTVNPQVGGQLMSLNFREGELVKKGQVLAQIDPRALQASYQQAQASKKQNEALLATARANFQRSNDPAYQQYVSKIDLDTLRNNVAQYQASVAASQAAAEAASVQLQFTRIVSPIDGIAGIRGVDVGNVVTTSTAIVTITQVQPIYATFNLPEKNLEAVRKAQAAGTPSVTALDREDAKVIAEDGVLDVVDNQVSTDSGTFRLRARFPNDDRQLWPGQFSNIRLKVADIGGGLVVPTQAVQRGPDGDYVYVVQQDNTVKLQTVVTGVEVGDTHLLVTEGLKEGERVVTEGQFRLKPGAKVNPLKPGEVPPAPTDEELKKAAEGKGKGGGRRGPPR